MKACLCMLAGLVLCGTAPAQADGRRLFPFWAQPYPFGYVQEREPDCLVPQRVPTRHGSRVVLVDQCRSPLRVRG